MSLFILQGVPYITTNICCQSQYRYTQLQYRFAVISEAPSTYDDKKMRPSGCYLMYSKFRGDESQIRNYKIVLRAEYKP